VARRASGGRGGDAADPLLERVLADPEDAGLRQVWADALLERDDPRGELISLQIAAAARAGPTPAQDKQIRSLLAKHRVAWLGELAGILQHRDGLVFDRGVLDACHVQVKSLAALERAIGDPRWATVRSVWFCDKFAWDPRIVPLLVHPILKRLREIWCIGAHNVFAALARHDRPLPAESIWTIDDAWRAKAEVLREIDDARRALPALRRLGFTEHRQLDWIVELPIVRRIAVLGITSSEPAQVWLERTEPLANLTTLELRPGWIPMQGPTRSHYLLRFTRGERGRWSRLAILPAARPRPSLCERDLRSIPATELEAIELGDPELRALVKRFARAEITAVSRAAFDPP
jgi:uncharacterized protein (TIGR02996 family)